MAGKILITGACGQIGTELTEELSRRYGPENVITADIKNIKENNGWLNTAYHQVDVTHREALESLFRTHKIDHVYHLAALLSATAEKNPHLAWKVNVEGLVNMLECCRTFGVKKLFFPSSIAVFGPTTPRENVPQETVTEPTTIYGITKLVGERLCAYWWRRWQVDTRSLRYPGLISWRALPGGGTTDYAVEIFWEAVKKNHYTCYLSSDVSLPMMYMPDAIRGTIELMEAHRARLTVNGSYNFAAFSFTPAELASHIKKHIPHFTIDYKPDFRDQLARTWPSSIDHSRAQQDWNWQPRWSLTDMVSDMLAHIRKIVAS